MVANNGQPLIVIEGLENILQRDLINHKTLYERTKLELDSFRQARSHEISKRKHYKGLIGGGKYNDISLRKAMDGISINIRHFSDKEKLATEKLDHHKTIIDTLTNQLEEHKKGLEHLAKLRKEHGTIN